jgi:hypothetical protein
MRPFSSEMVVDVTIQGPTRNLLVLDYRDPIDFVAKLRLFDLHPDFGCLILNEEQPFESHTQSKHLPAVRPSDF